MGTLFAKTKCDHVPFTIINDPVHGYIELHPLLFKIMNTYHFQRLKDIKQLGITYWVFPGASHNRFEHSIGTSHLCGRMIDILRKRHKKKENGKISITKVESLCVKVAGLCHDLGHGPFSHFFDEEYLPRVTSPRSDWKHEQSSCELFDFMLEENKELNEEFEKYGLKKKEQRFIKDLILGKKSEEAEEKKSSIVYEDRNDGKMYKKSFLYEIVNNKRNGIDCDKFDYFARDCYNVGIQSNFDCQRYFHTTRIMPIGDELQICVRDKEVFNLYQLFHTRSSLHQRVCQHKTKAPIEDMLAEALSKVDRKFKISSSINDIRRFTKLTDNIVYDICKSESNDEETEAAKDLLLKIQNRNLYKLCGEIYLPQTDSKESLFGLEREDIKYTIRDYIRAESKNPKMLSGQIFVSVAVIDSTQEGKDPIKCVNFFNKSGKLITIPDEQLKQMGPAVLVRKIVRVYAKSPEYRDEVRNCFKEMCGKKGYPSVTEKPEE